MLTERQLEILSQLLSENRFVSIDELITLTNMSERTVRYDISKLRKVLEEYNVDISYTSDKGFYIPLNHQVLAETAFKSLRLKSGNSEHKIVFEDTLFNELLFILATDEFTIMEELCASLYVSERTLSNYISEFNSYFDNKMKIKNTRNRGYSIVGSEFDICYYVSEKIKEDISGEYFSENIYQNLNINLTRVISVEELNSIITNYKKHNSMFRCLST